MMTSAFTIGMRCGALSGNVETVCEILFKDFSWGLVQLETCMGSTFLPFLSVEI